MNIARALAQGGATWLSSENQKRLRQEEYAKKLALLRIEQSMIRMRDELGHQYAMEQLKQKTAGYLENQQMQNEWERRKMETEMNSPMRQKELELKEKQIEYWSNRADAERREGRQIEDTTRDELKDQLDHIQKRMDDMRVKTKGGEYGEEDVWKIMPGFEDEYRRLQQARNRIYRQLGYESYNEPKPPQPPPMIPAAGQREWETWRRSMYENPVNLAQPAAPVTTGSGAQGVTPMGQTAAPDRTKAAVNAAGIFTSPHVGGSKEKKVEPEMSPPGAGAAERVTIEY